MAKTKISEFSANPANNTDIDSINIAEGCAPSGINDAIRELMAQLKDFQAGTAGDSFNGPVGTTTAAAGAFTTLSASGAVTLSGGTANGVAYLNGSKVLTTGSALWFDGTNFGVGTGGNALNHQSVIYKGGANAVYQQVANGSTGLASTNGVRLGVSAAGLGELYSPTALISYISNSEAMRLTSTGLGIGTSSPSNLLQTKGSGAAQMGVYRTNSTTGVGVGFEYAQNNASSAETVIAQTFGVLTTNTAGAEGGAFTVHTKNAGTLAERLRIDSSGNLLVGTTSSDFTNSVGVRASANGFLTSTQSASTNANSTLNCYSTGAGANRFYVGWGGTVYATSTSISAISDATLKENVRDLETGLTEVMALKPRRFDWKNGDAQDVAGFVAQEVEQVLPELVTDYQYSEGVTKKSLRMGDILPTLVNAIQEQQAIIEDMKTRLAAAGI